MEKEYYTKNNYDKLQSELIMLKERQSEIHNSYYDVEDKYCLSKSNMLTLYNSFLEAASDKLYYRLLKIGITFWAVVTIPCTTISVIGRMGTNTMSAWLGLTIFCGGLFGGLGIFAGFLSSHKKLWRKKKAKLEKSQEYLATLSKVKELEEVIDKKEEELKTITDDRDAIYKELVTINSKVSLKKQEVSNFESEYANLFLNIEQDHKTRVLEK